MITENVSALKINKLTQEQYDAALTAGILDENALYCTPREITSNSGGRKIEVVVTAAAGSTVYYSDEEGNEYTQVVDSTGQTTIVIPKYGTYSFYAVLGDQQSDVVDMVLDTAMQYELKLSFYKYYGVKIEIGNSDPEAAVTYIDSASGMTAGWDNWKDTVIFKDIKPCVLKDGVVQYYLNPDNYTKKEDGTASTINSTTAGDVMVEIPKLGYKMTTDGTYHYIWVTEDPNADGYCYAAHSKNELGDCDKIYVGAYLGYAVSSKLYSISGKTPTASINLTNFRTYATARGDGYELFSFYPMTLLQCLYLLIFKNRDSQSALGKGFVEGSAAKNTGIANSRGFMYGSTTIGSNDSARVKFLGIEDFWGNLNCWVDGLRCDSSYNILTYYKDMTGTDDGTGYQYSCSSGVISNISGYTTDIVGTNHGGFMPNAASGSDSTYYADRGYWSSSSKCVSFGGNWSNGTAAGVFALMVSGAQNSTATGLGARLIYKHIA